MRITTTKAGATVLAASVATALTTAGGAAADTPRLPIVDAVTSDVANVVPAVAAVAPDTRAAVAATVHQVADNVQHTVKATKFVAQDVATQSVKPAVDSAAHVTRNTVTTSSRVVHSATRTSSRLVVSAKRFTGRRVDNTMSHVRSGSLDVAKPVMGGWQLQWAGLTAGCTTLQNSSPQLLSLQPFRIGVAGSGHSIVLSQRDMNSSLEIGC